jgi:hypothetical protein
MREVLVSRFQGELIDLKTNGFELLLSVFYCLIIYLQEDFQFY